MSNNDTNTNNQDGEWWGKGMTGFLNTGDVIQDWKVMPRGHSQTVVYS